MCKKSTGRGRGGLKSHQKIGNGKMEKREVNKMESKTGSVLTMRYNNPLLSFDHSIRL